MATNSAIVGILRALLLADIAEFDKAMKRASDGAKAVARDFKKTGQEMTTVGAALTKTVTLPIVAAGAAALKLSTDFESSFAGVRKTVKATETQFAALAMGLRGLSKEIPINVNELNKIGEAAGQLGIKTDNILGFTEVMAKLGVTTNLASDQAATSLARLANITQMPQSEFDRLGSTIVALGNNFATTESEIVDFGLRIAGAGKIAGLTEDQILAIGAAMSSVGIEAEAGGTAVQKVLNDMTAAVAQGGKSLRIFAETADMSADQFKKAFKENAADAFASFVKGLATQGDNAFAVLDGLQLGNERVIRAFLSLANAGDLVTDTLRVGATAWRENTALTVEAQERFKTTASQLTLLWNRLKDVGITIGNALLPAVRALVGLFDATIPVLESVAGWFARLPVVVQFAAAAFLALAAATGPVLFVTGQLVTSLGVVTAGFAKTGIATKTLGVALGFLAAHPVVLAIAGLALLGTGIYAVATAESELERSIRTNSQGFKEQSSQLETSLRIYDELVNKQGRTKEETDKLDKATRALAEASGLSKDAFSREESQSNTLTTALREQLKARKELMQEAIAQARTRFLEASEQLRNAQESLTRTLSGEAVKVDVGGPGGASRPRPMLANERVQEVERLNGVIAGLTKTVNEARDAYDGLTGVQRVDIALADESAAAKGRQTAAQGTHNRVVIESSEASKKAKDAADALAKALEAQLDRLRATGVVLQKDVAAALKQFHQDLGRVRQEGEDSTAVFLTGAVPALEEFAAQAAKAGRDVTGLQAALAAARGELLALRPIPAFDVAVNSVEAFNTILKQGRVNVDLLGGHATVNALIASDSMRRLGLVSRTELMSAADAASAAWVNIVSEYGTGSREANAAYRKMIDAQKAASGELPGFWQTEVFPGIARVVEQLTSAVTGSFAQMFLGAKSFKDGFIDIWQSIKAAVTNIFNQILNSFTTTFLQGMLRAVTGQSANFGKAFAGLIPGLGSTAATTAAGIGTPIALSAPSGAATGAAVGAGISTGALIAATGGIAAAAVAIYALYRAQRNDTKKDREKFAEELGFEDVDQLFAELRDKVGGQKASDLINQAQNVIGKKDREANKKWMEDVVAALTEAGERAEHVREQLAGEGLWDKATRDAVRFGEVGGEAIEGVAEALQRLLGRNAAAAGNVAAGLTDRLSKEFARLAGFSLEDARALQARAGDPNAELTADENRRLQIIQETNARIAANYQEEFDRINRLTLASFNAQVAEGKSRVEAVRAVGPAIDQLQGTLEQFGLAGGAAFDELSRLRTLTRDNEPLLNQAAGVNELAITFANLGVTSADVWADLQAQGAATHRQLMAAGFTEAEALTELRPLLQTILQLQKEKGLVASAETQALIDLAKKEGILGAEGKKTNDILTEGFHTMRDGIGALIKALGGELPESFRRAAEGAKQLAGGIQAEFDNLDLGIVPYIDPSGLVSGGGDLALAGAASNGGGSGGAFIPQTNGTPARISFHISKQKLAEAVVDVLPGVVEEYVGQ